MIGYVTIGTNDLAKAAAFYDALLGELGAQRYMEDERFIGWAVSPDKPVISINTPYDGKPASVGNGMMVAIPAKSHELVDQLYNKAIELGATDEGPAGARSETFYGGYFRDLDGNKLCAFCFG